MSERRYRGEPSRPIPVWNGILEHRSRIDSAIWVFLWLLDRVTKDNSGVGLVLGGAPVKASQIATDLDFDEWTVRQHLQSLEREHYVKRRRTSFGHVIEVCNSRKFGIWQAHKRSGEKPQSEGARSGVLQRVIGGNPTVRSGENPSNIVDAAVDAAITQQQLATKLASKPEDSIWGFLKIQPCGPMGFRALLESRWASCNGGPRSILIGESIDAWEAAEGGRLRRTPRLFQALAKLRDQEKQNHGKAGMAAEPIHTIRPEEIPA